MSRRYTVLDLKSKTNGFSVFVVCKLILCGFKSVFPPVFKKKCAIRHTLTRDNDTLYWAEAWISAALDWTSLMSPTM